MYLTRSYLVKAIVGILHDVARVVPKLLTNRDEVHGDEKRGEDEEAKGALPSDGLQGWHVVLGHELLLVDHVQSYNDLRPQNENVAEQNVRGGLVHLGDIPGVVTSDDVADILVMEEGLLLPLDAGRVMLSATVTVEDVTDANGEEAADDKENPDPLVAEELLL